MSKQERPPGEYVESETATRLPRAAVIDEHRDAGRFEEGSYRETSSEASPAISFDDAEGVFFRRVGTIAKWHEDYGREAADDVAAKGLIFADHVHDKIIAAVAEGIEEVVIDKVFAVLDGDALDRVIAALSDRITMYADADEALASFSADELEEERRHHRARLAKHLLAFFERGFYARIRDLHELALTAVEGSA